jgi:DsbC/DsbD-like thiol-disulfide interchange protein
MIIKNIIFLSSLLVSFLILLGFSDTSQGNEITTAWKDNYNSSTRLIIGNYNLDKKLIVGLELSIEKGSYSYWRNPGDSGISPIIDFQNSTNIEAYNIKYPIPELILQPFGSSNGYRDSVIFPIILEPKSIKKPLHINIIFDYGICDTVCVPVSNKLSYKIDNLMSLSEQKSLLIDQALEQVPKYNYISENKVLNARLTTGTEGNLYLKIELNASKNASLFIEENEKLYLSSINPPEKLVNGNLGFYYEVHSDQLIEDIIGQVLSLVIVTENSLIKEDIIIEQ